MKKQLYILILLMVCILALPLAAGAASGKSGNLSWTVNDSGVLTISGTGDMKNYVEMNEDGLRIIEAPWGTLIKKAVINSGVSSIGSYAFQDCSSLTSVTIPGSVTSIGEGAFGNCSGLTSLTIPDGVVSIGRWAFSSCSGLKNITFPHSITSIDSAAFASCSSLSSVTIPDSVSYIGESAFQGCSSNLVIRCYPNSAAHEYAQENGINVVLLGDAKPVITAQPRNVTVKEGYMAYFTVTATDAETYQWYYRTSSSGSWTPVKINGTSAICTLTAEARHNGYQYRCLLKNNAGSVYSNTVTLTVTPCISTVIVTIPAPAAGAAASYTASFPSGGNYTCDSSDNGTYSKNGVWWRDNTGEFDMEVATASFMQGHVYRVRIYLVPKSGYAFSDSVTGIVNGNTAIVRQPDNEEENWVRLEYTFPAAAAAKPTIAAQPKNVTVAEGKTATFKVVAAGATGYKWYYMKPGESTWNEVSKNGTSAAYSLTAAARHNGYKYRCKVSNSTGHVYSSTATLTVISKPMVTAQPTNVKVNEGKTATFKVVATGATSYQWYYKTPTGNWTPVSKNGTSATYSLTTEARHNGNMYSCKVSNSAGYVWSDEVKLTVNRKPVVTSQPSNVTVTAGSTATFKVTATGATSYQWYYKTPTGNWTPVSKNGTSATYKLTTAARHNGNQYSCKVSNSAGYVWSNEVKLTVKSKPVVTSQPSSVTVKAGGTATFKVTATGAVTYQWYYKTPTGDWTPVSKNGTSATYKLTTAARHNGNKYSCKISNSAGYVWSKAVTLTVK